MTSADLFTAADLERLHGSGTRAELVRGRLVVREPAGFRHGAVAAALAAKLTQFVNERSLGGVVAAETGFKLAENPDTVRAPDIAFVCAERVPRPLPTGYAEVAPDLAVEVLSPTDRAGDVLAKVADWLSAGSRLVWVIDAERRVARVYRADGTEALIDFDGVLGGEGVVPGFTCPLELVI
jgi:Uma2 family endonuclease